MTRLVKADLIESTPGIHGGYRLTKKRADLSFLEVIRAIEGTASLFQGTMEHHSDSCLIEQVMMDAEQQMETYLKERKLSELADQVIAMQAQNADLSDT